MRQDIILKPWQIELTTNSTGDSFEESTFFTGNGRMGIRGYLPFWQEKRTFETGLFVAGIFGEIKPGITDFVNLPTPVWGNIECDGHVQGFCRLYFLYFRYRLDRKRTDVFPYFFFRF